MDSWATLLIFLGNEVLRNPGTKRMIHSWSQSFHYPAIRLFLKSGFAAFGPVTRENFFLNKIENPMVTHQMRTQM